jgi:hypothetical protein
MTYAYHEVDPAQLDSILQNGLMRSSTGAKTNESAIVKTDQLLDHYRPEALRSAGVSRQNNIYAYFATNNKVADIISGQLVELSDFIAKSEQAVLRLAIDPKYCYVSDLDMYDNIKLIVEADNKNTEALRDLAARYWDSLIPFSDFEKSMIRRPEIMITYDIRPRDMTILR